MTGRGYCLFDTSFGRCGIGWGEKGISHFQLPSADSDADDARLRELTGTAGPGTPPPVIAKAIADLVAYFDGVAKDFSSFPVDLSSVEPFHARVLAAARKVGWGEISSYGALAREVADDVAVSRAVGQAMGRNPIPVIIPCHRILTADGRIGGFSAPGGTITKTRLLELEGALRKTPTLAQTSFDF